MSASVKVAVRVRPFNEREEKLNCSCIVQMQDNKTILFNKQKGNATAERKEFGYDHSYWSHDTENPQYASQEKVYNDLGSSVVTNSLQGYNACVFAYGQTGSGKTFTMMGSKNNPGLIPRICKQLFLSMEKGRENGTTYKVEVSYLEIYNEKVKDLLCIGKKNLCDLRIRDDPVRGPFVENLSHHLVSQYSEMEELIQRGNVLRTTASTNMNDTSSRSHAIFTITFIQAKLQADVPIETRSKINLVDLAGSERADATGASGARLREGGHINKSLVTLGSVISLLAESVKQKKEIFIPYRNSKLTYLLKDSLGGNSKTIMIATISPANVNYGETLGTLHYASRAKTIINKPTINEDPNVKLIRELREEISKLRNMIDENLLGNGVKVEGSIRATLSKKEAQEKELTDKWNEKWRQTQSILQEQRTLELRKAGESGRGVVLDSERPHLVLYDDDLGSSGLTLYHLNDEITTIGASQEQDIQLEGQGMLDEHCIIKLQGEKATLERKVDAEVKVNDKIVESSTKLIHGAMIMVGGSHVFRYNDPQEAARIRKQGNRSSMNLSRLSFLSRSTADLLLRSYDSLPGSANCSAEVITFPKPLGQLDIKNETEFCEISTQTSAGTQSHPNTPNVSTFPELCVERKISLTLPLSENIERIDVSPMSFNSTPASDTFYTATSILTPDVNDLLSPLSPVMNSEDKRSVDPLSEIAYASIAYSPIKPAYKLLNSPGASYGAATSTPKRRICDHGLEKEDTNLEGASNTSELISAMDGHEKVDVVLEKLYSDKEDGNSSTIEKKKEIEILQDHYTALANDVLEDIKTNKEDGWSDSEKKERPCQLPFDSVLKEKRVVLLIEKEVRRRLFEEICKEKRCLHKAEACQCHCENRMIRSASPNSLRSIPRMLSPSELRPYSSLSAECAYEFAGGQNIMYESRSSSDDLLLSPVPLHSPLDSDFDMSCGICVSLPSFELRGSGATAYWEYQIRLSVGRETWAVFRRYRRFRELHLFMSQKYGSVVHDLYFPPRRIFGNYSLTVIKRRQKQLEIYLQQLITLCTDMEGSPLCDVTPSRELLEKFSPFFRQGVSDVNRRYSAS